MSKSNLKEVNDLLFTTPIYVKPTKGDPALRFAGKLALNSGDSVHVATSLLCASDDLVFATFQSHVASNDPLHVRVASINPGNAVVFKTTANSGEAATVVGVPFIMWKLEKQS